MPTIDDIRINGQSSTNSSPTIKGLHPVIGWDFIETESDPNQASFQLKVGTSSVDHGTSGFTGDIINVTVTSGSNFYEYSGHKILRGVTYYGQIKALDSESDSTEWTIFTFITNNLPFVTGFFINPIAPTVSNDLELVYKYHDLDGHSQAGTKIRWYKNNIHISLYDDLCILPSIATISGESWNAKIIPSDGIEFGAVVETESVTILDSDSLFSEITIAPLNPNIDDILRVDFSLLETEYVSTNGVVSFQWNINGIAADGFNGKYARLDLNPGDLVSVSLSLTDINGGTLENASSDSVLINDSTWKIFNLSIDELTDFVNISELSPNVEWKIFKSKSKSNDVPANLQVLVTKTKSRDGAIFDSGVIQYTKNSYIIPEGVLSRGQTFFLHVGVSDKSTIPSDGFVSHKIEVSGSSWLEKVDNNIGWTIETKLSVIENSTSTFNPDGTLTLVNDELPSLGMYIHDGKYFCSIVFGQKEVVLKSDISATYTFPNIMTDLRSPKTFKIAAKNQDVKIFMDNKLIIDAPGILTNLSNLKFIEYGDISGKFINEGHFKFFRYSTKGPFGFGDPLPEENTFYFHSVGDIQGGKIQYVLDNLISWLPEKESSKLIKFNPNATEISLPTASTNFSPITALFIDKNRNKFIGTANGVNAIFGEKHDPDYKFDTSDDNVVITTKDFDRISTVPIQQLNKVEPDVRSGWMTIDTTYRSIGELDFSQKFKTGDPYDPYTFGFKSHAIHYYTQRSPGHSWFDNVDNQTGWQAVFSFDLDNLEQDDFKSQNTEHQGFGVFINDGDRQEILFFYEDRIRLFYANVFVPIITTIPRVFKIVGKGDDLLVYQKIDNPSITSYQLLINATGMFTTPASATGNSRKPKLVFDNSGLYHAVWQDDANGRSQIFYSVYDGESWSNPEIAAQSKFILREPDIVIDNNSRVWICYEDTSWGDTEISVSVRDSVGWSKSIRVTNYKSDKQNPAIEIDAFDNIHLVWEDNRNGNWEIFWSQRLNSRQAWISSGQYGEDVSVMSQNDSNDPYTSGAISFKNAKLTYVHPKLWLVAEGIEKESDKSSIYSGFRDVEDGFWNSSGVSMFSSSGNFIGTATSTRVSEATRNCLNPHICSHAIKGQIVVVWEDQTEPITQIWGSSFNNSGAFLVDPTQITARTLDSHNPTSGFISNQCAIIFESNDQLYLSNYDSTFLTFNGSNTGDGDTVIGIDVNKKIAHPSLANFVPAKDFRVVYDFLRDFDNTLSSLEFPDFYLIGDAVVSHAETSSTSTTITTTTDSQGVVSNLDTKEFAFGDMSENVGLVAHWKDIQFYFGYDAKPHVIGKFNSNTVTGWTDNRVNDLFVDVFGNIIVATFSGLLYHNVFSGELTKIEGTNSEGVKLLENKIITAVSWGGNGAWYVGSIDGLYLSTSAGQVWSKYPGENFVVNRIAVDSSGNAVCATSDGVKIASPDLSITGLSLIDLFSSQIPSITENCRAIGVDENNIIWVGTDVGLGRIENQSNGLFFNRKSGMRSSHVTDIEIVDKHLRFISTANGIDKMHGTVFSSISTQTHDLINNNISRIIWDSSTKSLWASSMDTLHEIVFRDPFHNIIEDEIVQYSSLELLSDKNFDRRTYIILDINEVQESEENLEVSSETVSVFINKNKVDFGFSVGSNSKSVVFLTDLLTKDEVEVKISSKFIEDHSFAQTEIEKKTSGVKRTGIKKIAKTFTKNQQLLLSNIDKHAILLDSGSSRLPFTTILLDRDLPAGGFKQIDTLTSTTLKFKILAFDQHSGIDGYILSNFENFTSDGETPLDFKPLPNGGIVTHDIGSGINNVTVSLSFPGTTTINNISENVGNGSALGQWTDPDSLTTYLYAATSEPAIIWRLDPVLDVWSSIVKLSTDDNREVTEMLEFNNVLFVATGLSGGSGIVYKTINGVDFDVAATSEFGSYFNSIAAGIDGTVYFGDDTGRIYRYIGGISSEQYSDIGDSVSSLAVWQNILIASTGNKGRIYEIDTSTGDNLIVFTGNESDINVVHIKDSLFSQSPETTLLYAGSSESTNIYRGNLDTFSFIKSFNSVGKDITKIKTVPNIVLQEASPEDQSTKVISSIGDSLFKHSVPSWEFFYKHDEPIHDFLDYGPPGSESLYVISNDKISRWSKNLITKNVFLRLRDKSGNISESPSLSEVCPNDNNDFCYQFAYSLNISDLKNFINESRIVDITEYGEIVFTYDSPNNKPFYSADEIDEEKGIYVSEVFNGSNDIVSWKTISWDSNEPVGTSVDIQIRSSVTSDDIENQEWSPNLNRSSDGLVSIEHITDQYIQFRAILLSQTRDLSPSLTSVTVRNITTQSSHFFTTNFIMPSRITKGILTTNTVIPVSADIIFGINTKNSTDFGDYQIIEPNRLFTTSQGQFGKDFRIGAKLLSPGIPQLTPTNNPGDPYDSRTFTCVVNFDHTNIDTTQNFHYRIRFYNDTFRTQLIHSFFSGNDQTGWSYGSSSNTFPSGGISVLSGKTSHIKFEPLDKVESSQKWFITIEFYNGSSFQTLVDDASYICSECNLTHELNLNVEYYSTGLPDNLSSVPQFSGFTPDHSLLENNIYFPVTSTNWTTTKGTNLPGFVDNFAVRFVGKIQAPVEGVYTFELQSNDGSLLFIDSEEVINHDGLHEFTTDSGSITLTEGFHDIELQYFSGTGEAGLDLRWITPGNSSAVTIPPQRFFRAVASEYCDISAPQIFNLGVLFELENGETVKLNLTP